MQSAKTELDERDQAILAEREKKFNEYVGPRVGDWVDFEDGTQRRISHGWDNGFQTSMGGSWYLSEGGHLSFSGSLYSALPWSTLRDSGELRDGSVWFFHHNWAKAHNGVDAMIKCRVYRCNRPAPR